MQVSNEPESWFLDARIFTFFTPKKVCEGTNKHPGPKGGVPLCILLNEKQSMYTYK